MTEKLQETGDKPEDIKCTFTFPKETKVHHRTFDELPVFYPDFFEAFSPRKSYHQTQDASGTSIDVLDIDYSDALG